MELKSGKSWLARKRSRVLIVPLWNWNPGTAKGLHRKSSGFNRTFMELKSACRLDFKNSKIRFNRTFMELKYEWVCRVAVPSNGFNRTFMELKCRMQPRSVPWWGRFNRTFMELKLACGSTLACGSAVLIVPLWNWNVSLASQCRCSQVLIVPLWNWNSI